MRFQCTDAGRSLSRRPKQKMDCSVRAFALATGLLYDVAYAYCEVMGRKCGRGFHLERCLDKVASIQGAVFGYTVLKLSFPAYSGSARMNVARFCEGYPEGTYILRMAKHFACVKDGTLLDLDDCRGGQKCVYTAFRFTKIPNYED